MSARGAIAAVVLLVLAGLAAGCTVGEDCTQSVASYSPRESELGTATIDEFGAGQRVSMRHGLGLRFVFDLPSAAGTFTLDELDAKTCKVGVVGDERDCTPATGMLVVREVHPREPGKPVGRLDADVEVTSKVLRGPATIDYRERIHETCRDVVWPDLGPMPGPR